MPEDPEAGSPEAAYAAALQSWLEENPGVQIQTVEVGIWDGDAARTAVAGGTAPAWYPTGPIGNWSAAGMHAAFVQGMYADLTELAQRYNLEEKVSPGAMGAVNDWKMGDRVYAFPWELVAGNGVYFRTDHLEEAGLEPPGADWTWEDLREYAQALTTPERKGLVTHRWGIGWCLGSYGMGFTGLLTRYPTPHESWPWRWDFTSQADRWIEAINLYRAMMFEDQSILSDITFVDGVISDQFSQGAASMVTLNAGFFTSPDFRLIAEQQGLAHTELGQLVGFQSHPVGPEGMWGNTQSLIASVALSPDLTPDEMEKAYLLFDHMFFGEGFNIQKQERWDATGDPTAVYEKPWPFVNTIDTGQVPGVDATPEDAFGPGYVQTIQQILAIPQLPQLGQYLPPEENPGPTDEAWQDKMSRWSFEAGDIDLQADLAELENILNTQAESFVSSIPQEDLVEGLRNYYQDLSAMIQQHAPEFHQEVYLPFYQERVEPNLS